MLTKKFFLSFPNGNLSWQGRILSQPSKDVYLCQLYSWLMGEATDKVLIPLTRMIEENWKFFDTQDAWLYDSALAQGHSHTEAEESVQFAHKMEEFFCEAPAPRKRRNKKEVA